MKRDFPATLFAQAVSAADLYKALKPCLPPRPQGRAIVVGAGKGAAQPAPMSMIFTLFLWNKSRICGAAEGTRTPDPIITNDVLYQLSYCGNRAK